MANIDRPGSLAFTCMSQLQDRSLEAPVGSGFSSLCSIVSAPVRDFCFLTAGGNANRLHRREIRAQVYTWVMPF